MVGTEQSDGFKVVMSAAPKQRTGGDAQEGENAGTHTTGSRGRFPKLCLRGNAA
jgi:hypothetical protein